MQTNSVSQKQQLTQYDATNATNSKEYQVEGM